MTLQLPPKSSSSVWSASLRTSQSDPLAIVAASPRWWRPLLAAYAAVIVVWILVTKALVAGDFTIAPVLVGYGALVFTYIVTRAMLAARYSPVPATCADDELPMLAVIIPCFNEGEGIRRTLLSALASDYPADRLQIIVVDDASTDDSWQLAMDTAAGHPNVQLVRLATNSGKRAAMAAGILQADGAPFLAFVDSDTVMHSMALKNGLAPLLSDERVGAVAGHADVSNAEGSFLARLQQARYFVAFRIIKAAETITGSVICASGCFSIYRGTHLDEILPAWEAQRFLGRPATFGDDRALTTMLLRNKRRVVYQSTAVTMTKVPTAWRVWWRQQLRWKKSWSRESLLLSRFAWKLGPLPAFSVYGGVVMTLFGPMVLFYFVLWRPLVLGGSPWLYLCGLYAMAMIYGLVYGWARHAASWWRGVVFALASALVMSFQVFWAMVKIRDTGWGTRSGAASNPLNAVAAETVLGSSLMQVAAPSTSNPWNTADAEARRFTSGAMAIPITALPLLAYMLFQ
jgi:hyaluronan synthase